MIEFLTSMFSRRITSATLIANAPSMEEAARRVPEGGNCSIGIHLNLTEFQPLTPPKELGILGSAWTKKDVSPGNNF